jgi:RND superfamily putative drug exporter
VIASAAGAVVIAFMALVLAAFGGFRNLGPGLAIAVALMAVAAVTLVPAVVSLFGTWVFWPSKSLAAYAERDAVPAARPVHRAAPGVVAVASGGLLVVLALGALGFKTDFDQFSQLPDNTEAAQGLTDLRSGFPVGALNPTSVYVRSDTGQPLDPAALRGYATTLTEVSGVGGAMPAGLDGSPVRLNEGRTAAQINLLLDEGAYSNEALALTGPGGALRAVAHAQAPPGSTAFVGGDQLGVRGHPAANNRDLSVIFRWPVC